VTTQQADRAVAILFSVMAALAGLIFLRLDWAPRIDFDITGFLWALSNAGRLTALVFFILFAAIATKYWIRAYLDE
jgi:hypothetical protein